ncbi:hypothetical protein [Streptomyces sp. NPDC054838]
MAADHPGRAPLHRVDPGTGLTEGDLAVLAVRKAGGAVELDPVDVPDLGRMAMFTGPADPFGARFAVITGAPAHAPGA